MRNDHWKRMCSILPPVPWHRCRHREADGDIVVLLHGLWRSYHSMELLAEELHRCGYETLNIPYASFRNSFEELVVFVHEELSKLDSAKTVHFVTHSMGGILTRHYLSAFPERRFGRAVMLAPPNQGSEIVDWLIGSPLLKLLGPAGADLATGSMKCCGNDSCSVETLIVMGNRAKIPFLHYLLDSENDGILSVASGQLGENIECRVVDADHTLIMTRVDVIEGVCEFLQKGI